MTRKIIAMIGEPATGKSSIVGSFMIAADGRALDTWQPFNDGLVTGHYKPEWNLYVLGRYGEGNPFPGTDRFSMAVQPQAIEFVKKHPNDNILFEGDRLTTQSFLEFLADLPDTDFKILVVTVSEATLEHRHIDRKDSQSDTFKKGRKTKIENLRSNMTLMGYMTEMPNEKGDMDKNVQFLIDSYTV
jgi:hypothetical protein